MHPKTKILAAVRSKPVADSLYEYSAQLLVKTVRAMSVYAHFDPDQQSVVYIYWIYAE